MNKAILILLILFGLRGFTIAQENTGGESKINTTENPNYGPTDLLPNSNKALVLVNSTAADYFQFSDHLKLYLDNFGVPYQLVDLSSESLPSLENYSIIILGHNEVYASGYPISALESAIYNDGVGLCSFDQHLFDYDTDFSDPITPPYIYNTNKLYCYDTDHYITELHKPGDPYFGNRLTQIELFDFVDLIQNSHLNNNIDIVSPLLIGPPYDASFIQVSEYGNGKIVKWAANDWMYENIHGQLREMDDLLWRSIVWAARKPFVMLGMPNFVTMRVDDVEGTGSAITENFGWIDTCNVYGIKPWCGTFNGTMPQSYIPKFRSLIDGGLITASPHSFDDVTFIYTGPSAVQNIQLARDFYVENDLKMSKYIIPHFYQYSSLALAEMKKMGCEFIGTHILPDQDYTVTDQWLNCGPYRVNEPGGPQDPVPVYYGDYVKLNGIEFFVCLTEIRDDGIPGYKYEWYPNNDDVDGTIERGVRHLRRAMNSMVLASLFTHEYFLDANYIFPNPITPQNWGIIISSVVEGIEDYDPIYVTTDEALEYVRAKRNTAITNVTDYGSTLEVQYTANNDRDIMFYLFTEDNDVISYELIDLPQYNGNNTIFVSY